MTLRERLRAAFEQLKGIDPEATWEEALKVPRYDLMTGDQLEAASQMLARKQEALQTERRQIRALIEQRIMEARNG